ncbi:hypothetical protein P168DRAFT_303792 [Aspergillus campestris IBT 28561]|uniref:Uncharacterized protein n=1 Tax=Aspergillus campestris (strain IBT 28561) TaxID=1392248 RepID=A0A2I1D8D1_ASPC2|nr:uncharacterized protein P168DRAFT_303792 [Aspergillus campestris IBT 28561]PKY06143.1 hypothetical protein P168DRAFT_303792 [Aspergillus campestris IBT 28561]
MRFTTVHLALGLYTAGALGLAIRQDNNNQNKDQPGNASDTSWQRLTCNEHNIGNSGVQLSERWGIARADNAWALALQNWKAHKENPDHRKNFAGDFAVTFGAKDGFNCENIGNDNCNDIIECDDTKAGPAGSIILNSFAALHILYSQLHTSVYNAATGLSPAAFVQAFAPNSGNEKEMVATIIDAVSMIFTFGIASGFHGLEQGLMKVPDLVKSAGGRGSSRPGSSHSQQSSDERQSNNGGSSSEDQPEPVAGSSTAQEEHSQKRSNRRWAGPQNSEGDENIEMTSINDSAGSSRPGSPGSNDNNNDHTQQQQEQSGSGRKFEGKGFALDLAYGITGNLGAWMKDRVMPNDEGLQNLETVDKALAQSVTSLGDAFTDYVKDLFSGEGDQPEQLLTLTGRGAIMDVGVDLGQITESTRKLLGAKMIQAAWSVAPEGAGAHPFILKTDEPCGLDGNMIIPGGYDKFIPHDDMRKARACYNQKTVLLLHGWRKGAGAPQASTGGWGANALVGVDQLDEKNKDLAGITRDDIAFSAMMNYEKHENSNKAMGKALDIDTVIGDLQSKQFDMSDYEAAVRTPGLWNIPVCENDPTSLERNLRTMDPQNSNYWPCNTAPGEKYNGKGTNVHANNGCIVVESSGICAKSLRSGGPGMKHSSTLVKDTDDGSGRTKARIYAKIVDRKDSDKTYAKCDGEFSWPSNFEDVYFGEDNKLYDSNSQEIKTEDGKEQVCNDHPDDNSPVVDNPYFYEN